MRKEGLFYVRLSKRKVPARRVIGLFEGKHKLGRRLPTTCLTRRTSRARNGKLHRGIAGDFEGAFVDDQRQEHSGRIAGKNTPRGESERKPGRCIRRQRDLERYGICGSTPAEKKSGIKKSLSPRLKFWKGNG